MVLPGLHRSSHPLFIFAAITALTLVLLGTSCQAGESTSVGVKSVPVGSIGEPPPAESPEYTSSADVQSLSLDVIFGKQPLPDYNLDPTKVRTIVATGDIIPARMTNWQMVQKDDFQYPFAATVDFVKNADLTLINLEAPLVKGCQATMQGMVFCGDQRFTEGLTNAGVDIANLANNHSDNYGAEGISQTVDLLALNKIDVVGIGSSLIRDVNGLQFGLLAYNGVGPAFDKTAIRREIAALRPKVDVLIVAMHWGKEYVAIPEVSPSIADDDPREMGHLVIDAGADLIVGNHPHWVQGLEIYRGKLITYAHGNFIFDQMWSRETSEGVVGKYTFYDTKLIGVEFAPVLIENYAQPRFLTGPEARAILDRMETASLTMAARNG